MVLGAFTEPVGLAVCGVGSCGWRLGHQSIQVPDMCKSLRASMWYDCSSSPKGCSHQYVASTYAVPELPSKHKAETHLLLMLVQDSVMHWRTTELSCRR